MFSENEMEEMTYVLPGPPRGVSLLSSHQMGIRRMLEPLSIGFTTKTSEIRDPGRALEPS